MTTEVLVLSSALKIVFVLVVTVGVFAPVLIWAERRQSAMIQDRLGPSRAAIPLPPSAVAFLDKARLPRCGVGLRSRASLRSLRWWRSLGSPFVGRTLCPVSTATLTKTLIGFGTASILLRVGYGVNGHDRPQQRQDHAPRVAPPRWRMRSSSSSRKTSFRQSPTSSCSRPARSSR